jgi:hypothetical protein
VRAHIRDRSRAGLRAEKNKTMMMSENLTYIYVTWRDAHSGTTTWTAPRDLDSEPFIVRSSGFLLAESEGGKKEHLTICQSVTPDGDIDHVLHIPIAMVVAFKCISINPLKEVATDI